MSPRRVRFEARVFRGESVAFEACAAFRSGADPDLCRCGWLEDDHRPGRVTAVSTLRRRAPLPVAAFARRAS